MRCKKENCHSGPSAPTMCRSSHDVSEPSDKPIAKNGASGAASRKLTRPRFQYRISSTTAGRELVTVFEKTASTNSVNATAYHHRLAGRGLSSDLAMTVGRVNPSQR